MAFDNYQVQRGKSITNICFPAHLATSHLSRKHWLAPAHASLLLPIHLHTARDIPNQSHYPILM